MVRYNIGTLSASPVSAGASRMFRYLPPVVMLVLGFFTHDVNVYFFGVFVFMCMFFLLLNTRVPPILLFTFVFEWFFNQGQLFEAIFNDVSVKDLPQYSDSVDAVILLGLIGTAVFFLGMFLVARKARVLTFYEIETFFKRINLNNLLKFYLGTYILVVFFSTWIWRIPALTQPFYMLTYFRWSIFFLLFCAIFFQERLRGVLLVLILFDFFLGFLAFFANFKDIIYFSVISYWMFYFRSSRLARVVLIGTFFFMIYVGSLWSYVKQDYREFLNNGTGKQVVRVEKGEALDKFIDLAGNVGDKEIYEGFDQLLLRLSWIGAFNRVYDNVPAVVPHQDGALWTEGIARPFTPRALFPNKKILADSQELNYYSGLSVDEENTSISLSMVAGSYIDFGKEGMHIALFAFGLFCGYIFKKAVDWGKHPMIGYSLTMPMIYIVLVNEQSINRTVSSVVLYFAVLWFIKKFLLNTFIRYIMTPQKAPTKTNVNAPALR
jgi:hypothetical protein